MIERRLAIIIAGLTVFFTSAVLWNVFAPSTRRPSRAAPVDSTSVVVARADTVAAPGRGTGDGTVSQGGQSPAPLAPPVSAGTSARATWGCSLAPRARAASAPARGTPTPTGSLP